MKVMSVTQALLGAVTANYRMRIKGRTSRSTLADASEARDWRIYADFAQSLIGIARRLYAEETVGVYMKQTVYALDASTIRLCLSVFARAPFRSTTVAVKLHTLLILRENIPTFLHVCDGKLHDDRGYLDFERLHRLH
jgi:hypothetical protein